MIAVPIAASHLASQLFVPNRASSRRRAIPSQTYFHRSAVPSSSHSSQSVRPSPGRLCLRLWGAGLGFASPTPAPLPRVPLASVSFFLGAGLVLGRPAGFRRRFGLPFGSRQCACFADNLAFCCTALLRLRSDNRTSVIRGAAWPGGASGVPSFVASPLLSPSHRLLVRLARQRSCHPGKEHARLPARDGGPAALRFEQSPPAHLFLLEANGRGLPANRTRVALTVPLYSRRICRVLAMW